jgi:hypothetical protein
MVPPEALQTTLVLVVPPRVAVNVVVVPTAMVRMEGDSSIVAAVAGVATVIVAVAVALPPALVAVMITVPGSLGAVKVAVAPVPEIVPLLAVQVTVPLVTPPRLALRIRVEPGEMLATLGTIPMLSEVGVSGAGVTVIVLESLIFPSAVVTVTR